MGQVRKGDASLKVNEHIQSAPRILRASRCFLHTPKSVAKSLPRFCSRAGHCFRGETCTSRGSRAQPSQRSRALPEAQRAMAEVVEEDGAMDVPTIDEIADQPGAKCASVGTGAE